jgi:glutathione S-transferase
MIELYRKTDSPQSDDIEAKLKELVVAYKVVAIEGGDAGPVLAALGKHVTLPALKDDGKVISGLPAITAHLEELEEFVVLWRKFQSDACYCDEDE